MSVETLLDGVDFAGGSMADYLGLLAQIAPAAEEGARAYLQAYQQRCGRQLATASKIAAHTEMPSISGGSPTALER